MKDQVINIRMTEKEKIIIDSLPGNRSELFREFLKQETYHIEIRRIDVSVYAIYKGQVLEKHTAKSVDEAQKKQIELGDKYKI